MRTDDFIALMPAALWAFFMVVGAVGMWVGGWA